jgi:hypothetical protein
MPTNNPKQLPYQVTRDPVSGANSRAVQNAISSIPRFATSTFESAYVEPLALAVAEEPQGIELIRIVNMRTPYAPVLCGSLCHWTYRPGSGGALISSIDGLTSDPASKYRFTFRITYKAQV